MPGRHEGGEVVEAVGVEAPHERPENLAYRRDDDEGKSLDPYRACVEREEAAEHERRQEAERKLPSEADPSFDEEAGGGVRQRDCERDGSGTRHPALFARDGVIGSAGEFALPGMDADSTESRAPQARAGVPVRTWSRVSRSLAPLAAPRSASISLLDVVDGAVAALERPDARRS